MPGAIQRQVKAGTGDYHISTARIQTLPSTVLEGYLVDLHNMPHMDLTKPWYDQKCIGEASFYGLLYYVTGDMVILDDDSTGAMVFNKQLIGDYSLDMPYDLVAEGTWTLDRMGVMAGAVAELMSAEGRYGLREAYYDINLGTKVSRDPESTAMLDLIIENRVYDAGEIYSIGGIADKLYSATQGASIELTTLLAKNEKMMKTSLEKNFVKKFKALAEAAGGN